MSIIMVSTRMAILLQLNLILCFGVGEIAIEIVIAMVVLSVSNEMVLLPSQAVQGREKMTRTTVMTPILHLFQLTRQHLW